MPLLIPNPTQAPVSDLGVEQPKTIGSYWIYSTRIFNDSTSDAVEVKSYDSIVVSGMEEIDGLTYVVFSKYSTPTVSNPKEEYYRFSSDSLVSDKGDLLLVMGLNDSFEIQLSEQSVSWVITKTLDTLISANDQVYSASAMLYDYEFIQGQETKRTQIRRFYAPNIGLVRYDYRFSGIPESEYRQELIRYFIAE